MANARTTGTEESNPPEDIRFYRASGAYGEFSNFYSSPFETSRRNGAVDTWQTVEHYFQAHKFTGSLPDFTEVRDAKTPSAAAKEGRKRSRPLRRDWEDVKDRVMEEGLRLKFRDKDLRAVLLSTKSATIIEHTANDAYWADNGDGTGKNMLGVLLMRLRDEIRKGM